MADRMTLDEAQERIDAWLQKRGGYWSPLSQYARLAEEVGELGRELNHQFGDKPRTGKDGRGAIADELGHSEPRRRSAADLKEVRTPSLNCRPPGGFTDYPQELCTPC